MNGFVLRQKGFNNGILFPTLRAAQDYRTEICKFLKDKASNYEIFELGRKVDDGSVSDERVRRLSKDS
jgi:hypothetical protein